MRHESRFEPMTVERFLRIDAGADRKYELDHGTLRMLSGAVVAHVRIGGNILAWLGTRLRGTGFHVYGSGLALRTLDNCCRMPDLCVYRNRRDDPGSGGDQLVPDPVVVVEMWSASVLPRATDARLAEYRALPSIDTVVLVDPLSHASRVVQRLGPTSWRDDRFATPVDLALPALGLTIPHAEIFARD